MTVIATHITSLNIINWESSLSIEILSKTYMWKVKKPNCLSYLFSFCIASNINE